MLAQPGGNISLPNTNHAAGIPLMPDHIDALRSDIGEADQFEVAPMIVVITFGPTQPYHHALFRSGSHEANPNRTQSGL
jgi:hypothetical protein